MVSVKVTVERLPLSSVSIDIQSDEDEFKRAVDRAFRKISQQVRIPGFRPGRAPRPIVEQRVGREYIVSEAQRELMDDLFKKAIEQEDLTVVSDPSVDIYQEEPLAFKVEVQVYPDVELGDYTTIRSEPRDVEVTDADVDESLEELRRQRGMWVPITQPRQPQDGDQVIIDLQAYENDEPYQSPIENGTFELGGSNLFPQIEEALKNLSPGESAQFDITFSEDDERVNEELRGKTLHYDVTLNEIKERELPELDDDFAQTIDPEYKTLDDLRAELRKDILRTRAMEARNEVINTAIERMTELATVEVPPAMVDRQVQLDIERLTGDLSREGMSFEEFLRFGGKSEGEYRDEARPAAEERLRRSVVLESFAKSEGVEVTEEDLVDEIDRLTSPMDNAEEMRAIYSNAYFQRMIIDELANRKLTDRIVELVTEGQGAVTGEAADLLREMREPRAVSSSSEVIEGDSEGEGEAEAEPESAAEPAAESETGTEAAPAEPEQPAEAEGSTPAAEER